MSYALNFVGGPRNGEVEERKGAPQTVPYLEGEAPGVYRLTTIRKNAVKMVWVAKAKVNVKASHDS